MVESRVAESIKKVVRLYDTIPPRKRDITPLGHSTQLSEVDGVGKREERA